MSYSEKKIASENSSAAEIKFGHQPQLRHKTIFLLLSSCGFHNLKSHVIFAYKENMIVLWLQNYSPMNIKHFSTTKI